VSSAARGGEVSVHTAQDITIYSYESVARDPVYFFSFNVVWIPLAFLRASKLSKQLSCSQQRLAEYCILFANEAAHSYHNKVAAHAIASYFISLFLLERSFYDFS
jgi:hypothetical protein